MNRSKRLAFDVFGRRVVVEPSSGGWDAFYQDNDGKRRRADFVIPPDLDSAGIAKYLDDLFHELATADQPHVRVL
jgi:hypothetical protein